MGKKKHKKRKLLQPYPIRICKYYKLDGTCKGWTTILCSQFRPGLNRQNGEFGYYCHKYCIVEPEEVDKAGEDE